MIDSVSRPIDSSYAIHNGWCVRVCVRVFVYAFVHRRLFTEWGYSCMSELCYWLNLSENF